MPQTATVPLTHTSAPGSGQSGPRDNKRHTVDAGAQEALLGLVEGHVGDEPLVPGAEGAVEGGDELAVQQVPGVDAAVLAAADDVGVGEGEAGAHAVVGVAVGGVGLEEGAVGAVEETHGGVEGRDEHGGGGGGQEGGCYRVCGRAESYVYM
ncbi:hypothetical protein GP486_003774 [Trichoglossum hirsutum]|uniref:Uncharacterized protein n=1 Tax=Trichoglossum hirsutum TaxID=265104 RepID=A0A9P8LCF8_9PEZI|nr:hypothetical protein GP486_003774 [Trichoglossum hirsutum]